MMVAAALCQVSHFTLRYSGKDEEQREWSQDTKYKFKFHLILYQSSAEKNWLRAHFQFKTQIASLISESIGTRAEPRHNRQSR